MADLSIPGSSYMLRPGTDGANTFVAPNGTTLTQDQFVKKVESKEISLTENSLQFLDSRLGPDTMQSLRVSSGYPSSPGQIMARLNGTSDTMMGDLFNLLELLAKVTQDQKKQMQEVKKTEGEMQLTFMEQSAKKELEAATTRAIFGAITAGLTIFSGVLGVAGAGKALGLEALGKGGSEATLRQFEGWSKLTEGFAKGSDVGGGAVSANKEDEAKKQDIESKKMEQQLEETRNVQDTLREMLSKVKETLQAIQQAQSQTAQSVARM